MATFYAGQVDYISVLNTLASQVVDNTRTVVSTSTAYTAPTVTGTLVVLCSTGSNITVSLPTAVNNKGTYIIKKILGTSTLTVDGYLSQTIDGSLSLNLTTLNSVLTLISDGSNWRVI